MLAEWGDARQAYEHPDSVAALAGCTPVTKESGKHRAVHFRWACNKRFRAAITTFADNSRHASPWAAKIYNDARASGKDHPHAVRILARAWIRVIWRCWLDGVPYDPAKHGAAAALTSNDQANRGLRLTQGVSCLTRASAHRSVAWKICPRTDGSFLPVPDIRACR